MQTSQPTDNPLQRLGHERYLRSFAADSARLSAAAGQDVDAEVPYCTGWRVADLLVHAGQVWAHKAAIIAQRLPPGDGEPPEAPEPGPDVDLTAWHDEQRRRLVDAFAGADPDERVWTWADDDQTVRFWGRRMAHEALIHRIDAEAATGQRTGADDDLVLDGIDEVLGVYIGSVWWATPPGGHGETVRFETAGRQWRSVVEAQRVTCSRDPGPADATVRGEPFDLLLWLWGRADDDVVSVEGDREAFATLRALLRRATT
jgi:uncharacterized protein (TIGR03083 family)